MNDAPNTLVQAESDLFDCRLMPIDVKSFLTSASGCDCVALQGPGSVPRDRGVRRLMSPRLRRQSGKDHHFGCVVLRSVGVQVIQHRLFHIAESLHIRVIRKLNCLRCTLQHYSCLAQRIACEIQFFAGNVFISIGDRVSSSENSFCNLNSVESAGKIVGAIIRERYQCLNIFVSKWGDISEYIGGGDKYLAWKILLLRVCRERIVNGVHISKCHTHSYVDRRRNNIGERNCIFVCFFVLHGRNIKSYDNCCTCSYSCCNVPKVLRGACRSCNDPPYAEHRQKSDRNQQPDECQLRDFPRALHAFPALNFWEIVARCWALLRIHFPHAGEGPFLHRDAFLHPRRINVASRFV